MYEFIGVVCCFCLAVVALIAMWRTGDLKKYVQYIPDELENVLDDIDAQINRGVGDAKEAYEDLKKIVEDLLKKVGR